MKSKINKYIPSEIEAKWQEKWQEENLYASNLQKPNKEYVLAEFAYPSGDLHMGHWFTWSGADIYARFKRMQGKQVFFPNGFDAFGLPAENAAIKRGVHPRDWTLSNIEKMKKQYATMGSSFTFDHEVITCLPNYYRWNQWIFIKMFEKGLAYRDKALSNWCPIDQTVLANEHVENGHCWRCGAEVVQKEVEQWFLKITDYADRLEWEENPKVNWPKSIRSSQNDWIGKKEGMKITHHFSDMNLSFETFTAYPAWSWADTFIVIAPEHPLVEKLVKGTKYEKEVKKFVSEMAKETELERKETTEKKGVFTGRYAKDPFGGPDMPIWLANFALMNFGTGIIRCSGHDPRDVEFAQKYGIKLKEVVDREDPNTPVNAHGNNGILKDSGPFSGREVGEIEKEVVSWIEKEKIGKRFVNYHLHDWSVSRQRYWGTPVPMIHCEKCGTIPVPLKDLPVELPYDVDYAPKGKPPLASNETWLKVACPKCGGEAKRDAETLDTFFDSSWYFFRYISPKDDKEVFDKALAAKIMPVDIYFGGAEHTLGHTLYSRFFTKFFHDLGLTDLEEYAAKRVNHGVILGPDGNRMSKSKGNVVNPDEEVKRYGADTIRVYLAFLMPYEGTGPWISDRVFGAYRFLQRVWMLFNKVSADESLNAQDLFEMHRAVKKVTEDIQDIRFNTAVAALMEWLNHLSRKDSVSKTEYETFLQLLAPFAPHMTEELFQLFGNSKSGVQNSKFESIHVQKWPEFDEKYLQQDTVTIAVQVDGKVRETLEVQSSEVKDQKKVEELAKKSERVLKYLEGKEIRKVIYVPGKIINFVV